MTSFSDCDFPGILALVESPINARSPLLPIFSNWSLEKEFPSVGEWSIFQSAVCSIEPYEVEITIALGSGI